uniref:Inducer of CBF expression 5 n=1 Tax=Solanum tuberosum TaxID=4113 RepID=M1CT39_SOLTU
MVLGSACSRRMCICAETDGLQLYIHELLLSIFQSNSPTLSIKQKRKYLSSKDIQGKPIEAADNSLLDVQSEVVECPHC